MPGSQHICNEENSKKAAEEGLQGCLEVMDWIALCQPHGEDKSMTECVTVLGERRPHQSSDTPPQ